MIQRWDQEKDDLALGSAWGKVKQLTAKQKKRIQTSRDTYIRFGEHKTGFGEHGQIMLGQFPTAKSSDMNPQSETQVKLISSRVHTKIF